jgi:hypothetical protein
MIIAMLIQVLGRQRDRLSRPVPLQNIREAKKISDLMAHVQEKSYGSSQKVYGLRSTRQASNSGKIAHPTESHDLQNMDIDPLAIMPSKKSSKATPKSTLTTPKAIHKPLNRGSRKRKTKRESFEDDSSDFMSVSENDIQWQPSNEPSSLDSRQRKLREYLKFLLKSSD